MAINPVAINPAGNGNPLNALNVLNQAGNPANLAGVHNAGNANPPVLQVPQLQPQPPQGAGQNLNIVAGQTP
jgi:hypothetical protein